MSSSTSSSEGRFRASRRWDLGALSVVLSLLLCAEVGMRILEPRLSRDVEHIQAIPTIVDTLHAAPGPTVLFFGNSLTRNGVDLAVMEAELAGLGIDEVALAAVYPDDTTVLDWYYLFDRIASSDGRAPDVLVVGFASWHLEDRPARRAQIHRIARHFARRGAVSTVLREDLGTLPDALEFLAARVSAAFANRERVRDRVLDLVPHYRSLVRFADRPNAPETRPEAGTEPEPSYDLLNRFLHRARAAGTKVVLVAMPTRDGYAVDAGIERTAEDYGVDVIDAREVPGIGTDDFLDSLHLDEDGAEAYSGYLARRLDEPLSNLQTDTDPVR